MKWYLCLGLAIILAVLIFIATAPMHYRVFSYHAAYYGINTTITLYGFEGRRGIFGDWQQIGYGADTREEAEQWIKQQPLF